MYLISREWGIAPDQFWSMTFSEWLCEYEWKRPRQEGDYAGKLTRGAIDEIKAGLDGWDS
jgi:hypothetical protein